MKRALSLAVLFAFRAFASDSNEINPSNVAALMNEYRLEAGLPLGHPAHAHELRYMKPFLSAVPNHWAERSGVFFSFMARLTLIV